MPTTTKCSKCGSGMDPNIAKSFTTEEGLILCGECREDAARNIVPNEIKMMAGPDVLPRELGKFWIMPLAPGGKSPQELWEGSDRECVIDALLDFIYEIK